MKKKTKKLVLAKETVRDLNVQLKHVVGGAQAPDTNSCDVTCGACDTDFTCTYTYNFTCTSCTDTHGYACITL
jgi:hypothetical protein